MCLVSVCGLTTGVDLTHNNPPDSITLFLSHYFVGYQVTTPTPRYGYMHNSCRHASSTYASTYASVFGSGVFRGLNRRLLQISLQFFSVLHLCLFAETGYPSSLFADIR